MLTRTVAEPDLVFATAVDFFDAIPKKQAKPAGAAKSAGGASVAPISADIFRAIGAFLGLGLGGYLYYFAHTPADRAAATKKVEFDLLRGMRPVDVARGLGRAGLVTNAAAMVWLGRITQGGGGVFLLHVHGSASC